MQKDTKQTKLDQVIDYLKKSGMEQEKIKEFIINLNNMVAEQLYKTMMLELPEEDIKYLETIPEDQFDSEINKRYQKVSGKTTQQLSQQILDTLTTSILEETSGIV